MLTIYADYSGQHDDPNDKLIIYSSLIIDDQTSTKITERQTQLIEELKDWGLNLGPKFEFHTQEIIKKTGIWRHASEKQIMHTLADIRKIFGDFRIPVIALVIDKTERGLKTSRELRKNIKQAIPADFEKKVKTRLEQEGVALNLEQLKEEPLSFPIAMFFGLTNSQVNFCKTRETASLVVDEQFVKQRKTWETAFKSMKANWQLFVEAGMFFTWDKDAQPEWYIPDEITEVESYKSFGVQLADYAAYTTRSIKLPDLAKYERFSVLKNHRLSKIGEGIYAGLNY